MFELGAARASLADEPKEANRCLAAATNRYLAHTCARRTHVRGERMFGADWGRTPL